MGERGTQIGLKNITKNEKDSKANIPAQYERNTDVWLKQGIEWQRRGGSNARGQKKKSQLQPIIIKANKITSQRA